MQRDHPSFETPSKQLDEEPKTTIGAGESRQKMVESKYELNEREDKDQREGEGEANTGSQLDQIEDQIKKCGQRLEEIHYEMVKESDKYSERSIELERERTELRKRVMDLDYQHRVLCSQLIKESRIKQQEEKEKVIKQAEEQRERIRQEVEERMAKEKEEREKIREEIEESRRKREEEFEEDRRKVEERLAESRKQREEASDKKEEEGGDVLKNDAPEGESELDRSRRQLRIAQIEAELAESRLRRSRVAGLSAELDYLRSTYLIPSWTWRDYYPYYASPLHPYSYPYSAYPYRPYLGYRWWI